MQALNLGKCCFLHSQTGVLELLCTVNAAHTVHVSLLCNLLCSFLNWALFFSFDKQLKEAAFTMHAVD